MSDNQDAPLEGDGKVEMIIKAERGKVIMRFQRPMNWIAFDPANAVGVGKNLIDHAVECGANVEIKVPRRPMTRDKRAALIMRATHVFRSMQEKGRPPKDIAQHVVDSILSAIE